MIDEGYKGDFVQILIECVRIMSSIIPTGFAERYQIFNTSFVLWNRVYVGEFSPWGFEFYGVDSAVSGKLGSYN